MQNSYPRGKTPPSLIRAAVGRGEFIVCAADSWTGQILNDAHSVANIRPKTWILDARAFYSYPAPDLVALLSALHGLQTVGAYEDETTDPATLRASYLKALGFQES